MTSCDTTPRATTRLPAVTLALGAFAILPAHAQSEPPTLRETVVTATRTPTRADELVSDVVVIDRAQIEQLGERTLPELLARTAGVQVSSNGGSGKLSSVFIRGTEARHTILLIDGVRYGSATAGTPIWDNIPVDLIDHIEVVKGPASALYGSDGVGGVVQVFMRKGQPGDPAFVPRASVTIGSQGYSQEGLGFSGADGGFTYSLDLQHTRDKGFSATNPRVPFGQFNPDRDPFTQDAGTLSLGYQFNNDWKLSAGVLYANGENHYDDGPNRDTFGVVRTETEYVGLQGRVMDNWTTQFRVAQGVDLTQAKVADAFSLPGLFRTTQSQFSWQNNVTTPIGTVIAGLERNVQSVDSDTAYDVTSRSINSAFVGLNGNAGAHSWQLNARRDENSQFGNHDTWFAGYGYRISPNWRVNASYGTSFVAPSFNQLYYPFFSNPRLQPEEGKNIDVGITWTEGAHSVKLVGFDNKITGFITNTTTPENIPRARIQGWTLGYDGAFDALGVHASYDKLDPQNELTGKMLPRRAKDQVNLGVDYSTGQWKFGVTALYVGQRYDDVANTLSTRLGSFTTVDLFGEYKLTPEWTVQARVANLFDATYETAYGYNQRGLSGFLTMKWAPRR
ncbi:TonB-dependent receptor [Variovorax sp. dw_954]|uniref:TonB-dependent receptor domain-containing protein n=1 Tax=Variovorax sp. dw_954 TaxID=2720078 RepID=UPI001BD616BD|nr:TonB-dependent receptor [Variovorax sp. dw_954]